MKLYVRDFMGCEKADLEVSGVALLVGTNHMGKSSVMRAAGAVLCGVAMPAGLPKDSAPLLVRTGTAKAVAAVITNDGKATIEWPKAKRETEGKPPFASVYAAGRTDFSALEPVKRIEALRGLLKAEPTKEDLAAPLREAGISDANIDKVWEKVERDGWELSCKRAGEKGRDLKAQWGYVTGENYGTRKVETWTPQGWDDNLEGVSIERLEDAVTAARAELEGAIGKQAISADELEGLKAKAALVGEREGAVADAEEKAKAATESVTKAREAMAALPLSPEAGKPCPHCGGMIGVDKVSGAIFKVEPIQGEEALKRKTQQAEAGKALAASEKAAREADDSLAFHKRALAEARAAAKRVAEAGDVASSAENAEVDKKRAALASAELSLGAVRKRQEAERMARNIRVNQIIADVLGDEGARKTATMRALATFNAKLAEVCAAAGWGTVEVVSDADLEYRGRRMVLCSESEQYRIRVAAQVAIAEFDGSEAVVIDGAELLDPKGRGGLIGMLHKRGRPALVAMMAGAPNKVPNMAAKGAGVTYWIENGICAAIGSAAA